MDGKVPSLFVLHGRIARKQRAALIAELNREHATKTDVCIIGFVDTGHPALLRMWDKRQRGYRAMGYRMVDERGEN